MVLEEVVDALRHLQRTEFKKGERIRLDLSAEGE